MGMKLKKLALLFLFCGGEAVCAGDLSLRGGIHYSWMDLKTGQSGRDSSGGMGINTHFLYQFKNWSLGLSGHLHRGRVDGLFLNAGDRTMAVDGDFQSVFFSPSLRYHFMAPSLFYLGLGPGWSLQSVWPSDRHGQKLAYISRGNVLLLGFQKNCRHWRGRQGGKCLPLYLELSYFYQKSRKFSLVDITRSDRTHVLLRHPAIGGLNTHAFILSIGSMLF